MQARRTRHMKQMAVCAPVLALCMPLPIFALSLGEPELRSTLYQPLEMRLPLQLDGLQADEINVSLVPESEYAKLGASELNILDPAGLQFEIQTGDTDQAWLNIRSSRSMREPIVEIPLRLQAGATQLVRLLTVLLDIPGTALPAAPAPARSRAPLARPVAAEARPSPPSLAPAPARPAARRKASRPARFVLSESLSLGFAPLPSLPAPRLRLEMNFHSLRQLLAAAPGAAAAETLSRTEPVVIPSASALPPPALQVTRALTPQPTAEPSINAPVESYGQGWLLAALSGLVLGFIALLRLLSARIAPHQQQPPQLDQAVKDEKTPRLRLVRSSPATAIAVPQPDALSARLDKLRPRLLGEDSNMRKMTAIEALIENRQWDAADLALSNLEATHAEAPARLRS